MTGSCKSLRKMAVMAALAGSVLLIPSEQVLADEAFRIPREHVQFLTGDSWRDGQKTMRLYGIQSCLRGKVYSDHLGRKQDCGVVSAAVLAAIVHDTNPVCRPVASVLDRSEDTKSTVIVVCTLRLGDRELDLGSLLITQGFAFAALANGGKPVYMPYRIQEMIARQAKMGLWAFDEVPLPSKDLLAQ
ncbi:thermonuclease family protein [Rhizobium sp. C4]|uniref:thermonuclease family protein n=1 Tax=Rhizobium sp. C4 TaxID=1349800 RepID=UPI001E63B234|nr:thermonuclease family protein [Rhizobium sp. C4]MCD2174957.1 thermonuclease family protein [Rhizobium sp. C4]